MEKDREKARYGEALENVLLTFSVKNEFFKINVEVLMLDWFRNLQVVHLCMRSKVIRQKVVIVYLTKELSRKKCVFLSNAARLWMLEIFPLIPFGFRGKI